MMEIWGGIECTINRIEDKYYNQLDYYPITLKDLELLVDLGIKKIRYPVLWERHMPTEAPINWEKTSAHLHYLKENGITVIAGLVHHGSGPRWAAIDTDHFAIGLSEYAAAVAERFPWIDYYTPVNEPLTTARFCGLYGHWYPHQQTEDSFLRILVNECKATILAMEAIKKINPAAKLVHTEDLGKTYGTPGCQYQADFENHRRWLGLDLICGKVNAQHPLYPHLLVNGISAEELNFFAERPFLPAILGFNHYLTSDRYLDDDLSHYPSHLYGGNGKTSYVDLEAIRVPAIRGTSLKASLKEAWQRYGLPLAITEAHLHCGREDELRWFNYVWKVTNELTREGVAIKAVTAWALFGAHGWENLLTSPPGNYESGAFDVSSGKPRPTAVAQLIRHFAKGDVPQHPLVTAKGWWERDCRIVYPINEHVATISCTQLKPILIIGGTGTLGKSIQNACKIRNIHYVAPSSQEVNLLECSEIETAIEKYEPWAIINAAGFVDVDGAERNKDLCFAINADGPKVLADYCCKHSVKLVTFSTDLVFNGQKSTGYLESDVTQALNNYGWSKVLAEKAVQKLLPSALIIRTSAFFSPFDKYNFVYHTLSSLHNGHKMVVADDMFISPTYVPDLAAHTLNLLIDDQSGIWHLANKGEISWFEFANAVASRSQLDSSLLVASTQKGMNLPAVRPATSILKSSKTNVMPSLDSALDRLFLELEKQQIFSQPAIY